jgi:hypothetical protein
MKRRVLIAAAMVLLTGAAYGTSTQDLNTLTPEALGQILTGPGITITNLKYTGAPIAGGTFTGGAEDGLGIESGVILSTGDIADSAGPNTSQSTTTSHGTAGDVDLDTIVAPLSTRDAAVLEFDFVTEGPNFAIRYVFASEEYLEYVDSQFNDVFGFFVDGANIARVPGKADIVSINSINHKVNTNFFRNNPPALGGFKTEFDGFTVLLTAQAIVTPGEPHHIKLAIADTSDTLLDAAVFLEEGGISGVALPSLFIDPPEVFIGNGQTVEFTITASNIPEDKVLKLSAEPIDTETKAVFTPIEIKPVDGVGTSKLRLTIGNNTLPKLYVLVVNGELDGAMATATANVHVECTPPFIFGLAANQPGSVSVVSGGKVELRVTPSGSGPFRYQWYQGPTGSTYFPIAGGTASRLTTPAILAPSDFWVRVSNACGTTDSWTATVTPSVNRGRGATH